jgi:hypothetical protein
MRLSRAHAAECVQMDHNQQQSTPWLMGAGAVGHIRISCTVESHVAAPLTGMLAILQLQPRCLSVCAPAKSDHRAANGFRVRCFDVQVSCKKVFCTSLN